MTETQKSLAEQTIRQSLEEVMASYSNYVGAYSAIQNEPNLKNLGYSKSSIKWCLPKVSGKNLDFYNVSDKGSLRPGAYGISEPDPMKCQIVNAEDLEAILVPGIAFTKCGERLGRGGGYYDRVLERVRGLKIGVCFSQQILETFPVESWDINMDVVVTELGVTRVQRGE